MTPELTARVVAALHAGIDALEAERSQTPRRLWKAALSLEHVILSDLLSPEEEERVVAGMDSRRRQICPEIFSAFETTIENSFAALALGGHESMLLGRDSITENYLTRYEELARREIALAGIRADDRALFIGSGPLPISAIEYSRQTGCPVDCADFVPEAVQTSRAVLARLGLGGRIACHQARGETWPASDYSVILVGVLAQPKQAILENIQATCPSGCRIIMRTTYGLRGLIYQPPAVDLGRLPHLRAAGGSVARGDQVISSVLYVKAD